MYFDYSESDIHKQAKEKLFDLIKSRRINIIDDKGNVYDIFKGKHEDEFLHMESFIMGYTNDVLFSSGNSPCKNYKIDIDKPLCDQRGYYGAFEKLPCEERLLKNLKKETFNGASKYASYRPDISFGYNGKHKIWLEVKYKNPCSKNKIEFCSSNDITLLEIEAETIVNFNDYTGTLKFRNLYADLDLTKINKYVKYRLNKYKYILTSELRKKVREQYNWDSYSKAYDIVTDNLIVLDKYNEGLRQHLNIKGYKKILIHKDSLSEFMNIQDKYIKEVQRTMDNLVKNAVKEVNKNGFMLLSEFKDRIINFAPEGFKSKYDYNKIFKDHNLFKVKYGDHKDSLNSIGISDYAHGKVILLTRKLYNRII